MDPAAAVPAPGGQTVQVTAELIHLCPFRDEIDNGTVTITWTTVTQTLELHALKEWLKQFRDMKVSHEEVTAALRNALQGIEGIRNVLVESRWHTAGMAVTCST